MKGKVYDPFKDDRERTHKYFVISVVDDETDAEKFEAFVNLKFMRSHLKNFVSAINKMSEAAIDVVDDCIRQLGSYPQNRRNAEELLEETTTLFEEACDRARVSSDRAKLGITCASTDDRIPVPAVTDLEKIPDIDSDEYKELMSRDLTGDEAVAAIQRMSQEMHFLRARVIHLESAVHKLTTSGLSAVEELPKTHDEYKERILHSLGKEIDADSKYLFNLFIRFREAHKDKILADFKKENPTVSVSGLKLRGAHRTYEDATAQVERIAKDDDYMDTYIAEGGKWYGLPIRTDQAGTSFTAKKELGELLGSRMEATEAIKKGRREGRDIRS